jgi:acyl carrier protein phosphodiesterase
VNFFGHALLAHRRRDDPAFVLGAMLPDLASLCGTDLMPTTAAVRDGVAYHHRVDAVFHGCEPFRALQGHAIRMLRARDVPRGGARGAAHVAVELLLDGALAGDAAACRAYRAALAAERAACVDDGEAGARFARLRARLTDADLPASYAHPAFVADRVCGALSRRPLLALDGGARAVVHACMPELATRVCAAAPGLLAQVEAALRAA